MIEWMKTTLLFTMILTSIVLTWFLWTYQPEYETLDDPGTSYIEIDDIGESKSLYEVIFPREIIAHDRDEVEYLIPGDAFYEDILQEVLDTEFNYLTERSESFAPHMDHRFTGLEFVFNEALPMEIVYDILDFEDENLPFENLDRLRIVDNPSAIGQDVVAQFIDMEAEAVYESDIDMSIGLLEELLTEGNEDQRIEAERYVFGNQDHRAFQVVRYLPVERFGMQRFTYETIDLSTQSFRQVLFSDPEFVKNYYQGDDYQSYTDGNRMMNILDEGMVLEFIQPESFERRTESQSPVLEDALQYVNGHAGWTGDYFWDHTNEGDEYQESVFRMHMNHLPVLSGNVPTDDHFSISVRRSGTQITKYKRPLFQLTEEPFEMDTAAQLQGADQLFDQIEDYEPYDLRDVTDVRVGYHMTRHRSFAVFEPVWYANVGSRWIELENLTPNPNGGTTIGLE
ncbi:YycH family regulatory protein [Salisediminibacterium beveridgei]|uniref:Two-component system yycF/yycG regulatory protein yycH n=1 Tax=Salisediminibacterium beveridgei TaxID=632773 RepID=A0A1D7QR10_9BACI|nr:two-component system activity regulator YycH [Salisediminibacterium beveridgei]AOM81433.1 Two-component system yycF/yycG regulatory protein yycH [Salisediminibacterium beveridgei]